MKCPKCNKTLIIVERNKIQVDFCMFCKGIWFDNSELEMLSEAFPEIKFTPPDIGYLNTANTQEEKRKCPRCNNTMDKVIMNKKPPILDICPNGHGYWFDACELQEYIKNNSNKTDNPTVSFLGEILG